MEPIVEDKLPSELEFDDDNLDLEIEEIKQQESQPKKGKK